MKKKLLLSSAAPVVAFAVLAPPAIAQDERFENEADQVIVTASPLERTVVETIVGTSVVNKEELARNLQNTLAETIAREPGVSTTYFNAGASRPIIRGLGDDRIRVLDNGIGSIDASVPSPDHAVSIDPAAAEQVEIVRGTSMLLYGSSAAGGVVNVISGKIPTAVPEDGFDISGTVGVSTADDGFEGAGAFDLKLGDFGDGSIVLHGDGFYRDAEDYDIPGFAESARFRAAEEAEEGDDDEEEEEEAFGTLPNSFYETYGATGGISWVGENGYFGVSGTLIDSEYGLPGGKKEEEEEGEEEEGEEEEAGGFIDLEQRRIDFAGEYRLNGWLEKVLLRVGYADYEHTEFEGPGEPGTVFTNEGWEGRLEFVNREKDFLGGTLRGAQGVQLRFNEISAIGEEAFIPPSDTSQYGFFALKEYSNGPWRVELGGRYEHTDVENLTAGVNRDFDGFSVSGGLGYQANDNVFLGLTGFRTERAPSATELFADGPHLATDNFEIGNADLEEEVGLGVEGTVRFTYDRFRFSVNGFYTSYNDFVILDETGEFAVEDEMTEEFVIVDMLGDDEDGLPVFEFVQDDAEFAGFEALLEAELFRTESIDFHGDIGIDYVRATRDGGLDEDLPRIPPLSSVLGLEARHEYVDLRFEVEVVSEQNDVAAFELPTDGYELINLYATVRPMGADSPFAIRMTATNLNDQDARVHSSFRKDVVPLRGRNFRIALTADF
ncbi:MAG: TonB-dependent receptor [Pseudomonadota bacterium]